MIRISLRAFKCLVFSIVLLAISCKEPKLSPIRIVTELNIGESRDLKLSNGDIVKLSLLEINEVRDSICNAIRAAYVKVSVDGEVITLSYGNYNLPVTVGKVQIDCPVTKGYYSNSSRDGWVLSKDARFRLWPKGSPFIQPGTFVYPIKQKWFASKTQAGNAPNWGNDPADTSIYYHEGIDIGGSEGMEEIVSATDGLVISAKGKILEGFAYLNLRRMDAMDGVYVVDKRSWYIRYSHLDSIDPAIKPGVKVKKGQRIGFIGKQGSSGGWVHLHFDIKNADTFSGKIGIEDAYVYIWESYVQQYKPPLIAVARPHRLVWTGQEAVLDGRKSKSFAGNIVSYEWTFADGTTAEGPVQKKSYKKPGEYSEILKVTDSKGNIDYDFAAVEVIDRDSPRQVPTIHASYYPTFGIKPGDPVTFLVRTFIMGSISDCQAGNEVWDFRDGSPLVIVKSEFDQENVTQGKYAETVHKFSKPGHYIVTVERINECGFKSFVRLHVDVKNQ